MFYIDASSNYNSVACIWPLIILVRNRYANTFNKFEKSKIATNVLSRYKEPNESENGRSISAVTATF